MSASFTLKQIGELLNAYTGLEKSHGNETVSSSPEFMKIKGALERCHREGTPATPELKNYTRVLNHFCNETHDRRCSTADKFVRAIQNLGHGMDVPKAIKKARLDPPKLRPANASSAQIMGVLQNIAE
jgi:hypothetical protein